MELSTLQVAAIWFFIGCVAGASILYWLSVLLNTDARKLWSRSKYKEAD